MSRDRGAAHRYEHMDRDVILEVGIGANVLSKFYSRFGEPKKGNQDI